MIYERKECTADYDQPDDIKEKADEEQSPRSDGNKEAYQETPYEPDHRGGKFNASPEEKLRIIKGFSTPSICP